MRCKNCGKRIIRRFITYRNTIGYVHYSPYGYQAVYCSLAVMDMAEPLDFKQYLDEV